MRAQLIRKSTIDDLAHHGARYSAERKRFVVHGTNRASLAPKHFIVWRGRELRRERLHLGFSVAQMAAIVGVSVGVYRKFESGRCTMRVPTYRVFRLRLHAHRAGRARSWEV